MNIFLTEIWKLINEMGPYLLLGFLIAAILKFYVSDARIKKIAGKNNIASDIKLSLLGIPLPLCSCGVIPTGISLFKSGASKSATTSFFISTPQTGIDSIAVTYSLINLPFALLRPIVAFFTAILGGIFVRQFTKNEQISSKKSCSKNVQSTTEKVSLKSALRYAFIDFFDDISKWLVIGIMLAGLITVIIPDNFFENYIGNDYLEMFIVLIASIPLYVCATGSVPIAAALMLKGLSPGAALVLLMAGPATNMASITLIKKVLGNNTLLAYLLSISVGAFFFGILINNFMPESWFYLKFDNQHHVHLLPHWLEFGSAIVFIALLISSFYRIYFKKIIGIVTKNNAQTLKTNSTLQYHNLNKISMLKIREFKIEGLTCNQCKMDVEKEIEQIEGISNVSIDLSKGTACIEGNTFSINEIETTVNNMGYKYLGENF